MQESLAGFGVGSDKAVARARAIEVVHQATALFTRDPVVDALLARLDWPNGSRRLVEPCCGDGAFLLRAVDAYFAGGGEADALPGVMDAWELHRSTALRARQRLATHLATWGVAKGEAVNVATRVVTIGDWLTEGPTTREYDVVVGNPPYMRRQNVPGELWGEYELVVPSYAQADLMHAFLDRCVRVLRPGGVVGFVTADRWLFNQSAANLRVEIGKRFGIQHVERLDVKTSFYRPKQRTAGSPPRVHPVSIVLSRDGASLGEASVYPGAPVPPRGSKTLSDVCEVRLAPWLGSPGIFLLDAADAVGPVVQAVDTDDFVDGRIVLPAKRVALVTSKLEEPEREVMVHLDAALKSMAPRGVRAPRWLPPETWKSWMLDEEVLVVPRIAKGLQSYRVPSGVVPINHNLTIVRAGEYSLDEIEGVLACPRANEWVRACAPDLEGGYLSIQTGLLKNLPINWSD